MKRSLGLAVGMLVAVGLYLGVAEPGEKPASPAASITIGPNLLQNPGFETELAPWSCENWSNTAGVVYAMDTEVRHSGEKSLKITSTLPGRHACCQMLKGLQPEREYLITCWVRAEGYDYMPDQTPAHVACDFLPVRAEPRPITSIEPGGNFDWKKIGFTVQSPPGTQQAYFCLIHTKGTLWFDDVSIVQLVSGAAPAERGPKSALEVRKEVEADGQTLKSVEVAGPHYAALVTRRGGKIARLIAGDVHWSVEDPVESWATGLCKDWLAEDQQKEILTGAFNLDVAEPPLAPPLRKGGVGGVVVTASFRPAGDMEGLWVHRTFSFQPDAAFIEVQHAIKNLGEERAITPKVHNYLNIWRSLAEEPLFRLYFDRGRQPPVEARMLATLTDNLEIGDERSMWGAVIDLKDRGLAFRMEEIGPDHWFAWSGYEEHKGTLEMVFKPVRLGPRVEWTCSYAIHVTSGLASFGHVGRNLVCSVAAPDLYLEAASPLGPSVVEVKTAEGGRHRVAADLNPGRPLRVAIPSVAPAGPVAVSVDSKLKGLMPISGVPRHAEILPPKGPAAYGDKPYRFLPLTVQPVPDPGPDGFMYYFSDYYQHEGYLSPDALTMLAFGQVSRLKSTPGDIRLIIDAPEGIDILGGRFVVQPIERSPVAVGGQKGTRFRIHIGYGKQESRSGTTELIVRTHLAAPQDIKVRYATEVAGRLTHERDLPVHLIRIPRVGPPKELKTVFIPLHGVLDDYPDMSSFRDVGFQIPNDEFFGKVVKGRAWQRSAELAREMGLPELTIQFMRFVVGADQQAMNEDISGRRIGGQFCPTYRGPDFVKTLEFGRRCLDLGAFLHFFDPERTDGASICFCQRCLAEFKEYLTREFAPLRYVDPHEFMRQPSRHRDLHRAWILFKADRYAEQFRLYRQAMLKHIEEKGLDPRKFTMILAAQPGWRVRETLPGKDRWLFSVVESSLQDPRLLREAFDLFSPMIYVEINGRFQMKADMLEIPEELRGLHDFTDGAIEVAPTLSVGYPYSHFLGNFEPNGMMKYQLLEAFAAGAKGVVIYSEGWFDALDMKYFAEAMGQVLPVESILKVGKPIAAPRLQAEKQSVFVKGIESEQGAVILVSEYSDRKIETTVRFSIDQAVTVVHLATGKKVAESARGPCTFPVTLDKDRALLFFVGDPVHLPSGFASRRL